jgi:hypothetical protein
MSHLKIHYLLYEFFLFVRNHYILLRLRTFGSIRLCGFSLICGSSLAQSAQTKFAAGVSSFCKVWILCGYIPPTNKSLPGSKRPRGSPALGLLGMYPLANHCNPSLGVKEGQRRPVDRNTSWEGRPRHLKPKTPQDRGKAESQVTLK